jgi:hypothetical protein
MKLWFEASLAKVSKGGRIADAIRYGLNHWHGPFGEDVSKRP